jgi:predicted NAD-dependent protein-ADP-ribosyltransferase YbiA (DUF1768 family)
MEYTPDTDGVDHINIYSKGMTRVGKLLTNFASTPFSLDGVYFKSAESYWFYCKAELMGLPFEHFKDLSAYEAKTLGKKLVGDFEYTDHFKFCIKRGLMAKINQNEEVRNLLLESELPLVHYYAYGKPGSWKVTDQPHHFWQCEFFMNYRIHYRSGKVLNFYHEGLVIPDGAVYIGRTMKKHGLVGHKLANPFKLSEGEPRGSTIARYRAWLWGQIKEGKITVQDLLDLRGKDVVCFCHPQPCHGDVVLKAVEWAVRREGVR